MSLPLASSPPPSNNIQFAVFCSSKEARVTIFSTIAKKIFHLLVFFLLSQTLKVISLPSQVCISKQKISDSLGTSASNIVRASVVKIASESKDNKCVKILTSIYLFKYRFGLFGLLSLGWSYTCL